ncbi:MAG: ABC transporter permease [Cyanobacteriota bacterium]|jgi:lipopolysaccharide transport system permease protein
MPRSTALLHQSSDPSQQLLVLEPNRIEKQYWKDLWRYRELFLILAWRDVAVRYKQTAFGVAWALIRPFLSMLVFTVIFGNLAKLPTDGNAPYAIMVFAAMLPWQFFASALVSVSTSLLGQSGLFSKVYFPRLIAPAATLITCFIDFALSFIILILLMIWYQYWPSWRLLTLPVWLIVLFAFSMGSGLLISTWMVRYRDLGFLVPFMVQIGQYISPVAYSTSIIPAKWQFVYALNPMVGVIEGFRWAIIGSSSQVNGLSVSLSLLIVAILSLAGVLRFRAMEKTFVDVI